MLSGDSKNKKNVFHHNNCSKFAINTNVYAVKQIKIKIDSLIDKDFVNYLKDYFYKCF